MTYGSLKASDGTGEAVLAHVTANRLVGSTTLLVDSVDNWPANFIVVTGTINANGFISPSGMTQMRAHISGGNIAIDSFEPGYTDIGNTTSDVCIIKMTTEWANDVARLALVSHNDDGSIKDGAVGPLALSAGAKQGWVPLGYTPNTVTNNGNRLYDLVFNSVDLTSVLSEGMKLKLTRTVTAPTQGTTLNGTTQYWTKTSPNKLTFTDDFTLYAKFKLLSYPSALAGLIGRINTSTGGFALFVETDGRISIQGQTSGVSYKRYTTNVSAYLSNEITVALTMDLSGNNYTGYINGEAVSMVLTQSAGSPTALVQAGNLDIGAYNSASAAAGFLNAEIYQLGIFDAVLSAATIRSYSSQGLSGSEPNLKSGYGFNGVATDLNTTTPNNLTAVASAGYVTNSPFAGGSGSYETQGTTEYAMIVSKPSFSTNTTVQVEVPVGYAIPTSGGVSAVSYSTQQEPYGYPHNLVENTNKGYWQNWNPTLSAITVGNGTFIARYVQIGKTVHFRVMFILGSTSAVGTSPVFTAPVPAVGGHAVGAEGTDIGFAKMLDAGIGNYKGTTTIDAANQIGPQVMNSASTFTSAVGVSATAPFTWGTGDVMYLVGTYEAA